MPPLDLDPRTVDDDAPTRERSTATNLPDPGRAGAHTGIASAFAYLSLRARFFPQEPQTRLTIAGRYTLLEKLGEGAMGVVFAAFDGKLGRKVALKVVRSFGDADARARLLREAQSLAQLSDPNVVQVHEVDEYRGEVYVAMELVEGVPLGAWIAANKPGFAALFEVLLAAGRGLAAAHERGVIHRDIKPANILVGADGRARVADFGLAWVEVEGAEGAGALSGSMASTLPSVMSQGGAGTPAYMSPEQLLQRSLDARSDLFGFCVVVWETVYGAHPFPAESVEQVALRICDGTLAPPPARPRGVPLRFEKILRKGLAVDREQRHADMATLLAELHALRRPWTRTRLALAAGLGAALAFGGTQMVGLCRDVTGELDAMWTGEVASELRARLVPALAGQLEGHVERLRAGRTATCDRFVDGELAEAWFRRAQECFAEREQRLAAVVELLRAQPERAAAMTSADLAAALGEAGRCSEATYVKAEVEPPEDRDAATVAEIAGRRREGELALLRGEFRAAAKIFEDAVARAREVGHAPTTSAALYDLGRALLRLRRGEAATAALHEAQVLADGARDAHAAADASLLLVDAAVAGNRASEAQWHVDETLARLRAAGRARGGPLGELELARVDLLVRQDRPEEAAQALARASSLLHADPPESGLWRYKLPQLEGRLAELRGEKERAEKAAQARAALAGLVGGADHPLYLEEVGRALRQTGELAAATEQLLAARAKYADAIGPDSVQVATVEVELAKVYSDLGKSAEATAAARHADAILEPCPAEPMTLDDCVAVAGLLAGQALQEGKFAEALAQYERGLAALEKFAVPVQDVNVALMAAGSAELLVMVPELRDVRRARARIDRALAPLRAGGSLVTTADSLVVLRIAADVALAERDQVEVRGLAAEIRGILGGAPDEETAARIDFIEAQALGAGDPAGRQLAERALAFQRARGDAEAVAEIEGWLAGTNER